MKTHYLKMRIVQYIDCISFIFLFFSFMQRPVLLDTISFWKPVQYGAPFDQSILE